MTDAGAKENAGRTSSLPLRAKSKNWRHVGSREPFTEADLRMWSPTYGNREESGPENQSTPRV